MDARAYGDDFSKNSKINSAFSVVPLRARVDGVARELVAAQQVQAFELREAVDVVPGPAEEVAAVEVQDLEVREPRHGRERPGDLVAAGEVDRRRSSRRSRRRRRRR